MAKNTANKHIKDKPEMSLEPKEIQEISTGFMLTEYQIVKEMRDKAITRRESRANIYFSLVSGVTAFLLLISQLFGTSDLFYTVVFIVSLIILGYGTMVFDRLVEGHISVRIYARGINRIRRYFVEFDPKIKPFLMMPINDDIPGFDSTGFFKRKGTQGGLLRLIIFSNTFVASLVIFLFIFALLRPNVLYAGIGAGVSGITTFIASIKYFNSQVRIADKNTPVLFPSEKKKEVSEINR